MHTTISPAILYWGTPVVIVSTLNEQLPTPPQSTLPSPSSSSSPCLENPAISSTNIAPISSAWWLGTNCMLGLDATSATTANLLRTGQCVLNLASDNQTCAINALAKTTGSHVVPPSKMRRDYVYCAEKWSAAGLTPMPSQLVEPQRVRECAVQMECELVAVHRMFGGMEGVPMAIEVRVLRVHVEEELRLSGFANRIDAEKWHPLFMMFQEFFGLRPGKLTASRLAEVSEERYRMK